MRFGKSPTSAGVLLLALVVYSAAVCEKTAFAAPSVDTSDIFVAPMLGANWGQGSPMNDLTPRRSPCGCAATAGGQELRLWRWPYRKHIGCSIADE